MVYLIYTTVPNEKVGTEIARHLLEKKLVACANLLPVGKSFYIWDGQLQSEAEHVLFLKTTLNKLREVEENILSVHPYECPCIVAWQSDQVYLPFLKWVIASTA